MPISTISRNLLRSEVKKLRRLVSHSAILSNLPGKEPRPIQLIKSPYEEVKAPCKSLTEFVWKDVDKWSNHTAICCAETGRSYTYSNLRILCARFGRALRKQKFQRGQTLSIVLPNIPEYPIILLGAIEAGLTVSTLNPNFTPEELSRQLADSSTTIIVTLPSLLEKIKSTNKIIEEKTKKEFPVTVITLSENAESTSMFGDMISDKHDGCDLNVDIHDDDVAFLLYSSGTTGFPKGVQLTHRNLIYNLLQLNCENIRTVEKTSGNFQDVVPAVLPFFHIFGVSALILTAIINGSRIVSLKKFDPEKYLSIIKNEKATVLYLVPTLALLLTSHPSMKPNDLENVRTSQLAGGNTPTAEMEKLINLSGGKMKIRHGYGLTETSPALSLTADGDPLNSVGQPLSNTIIKIIDSNGLAVGSYQRGEICAQGPQIMKGYLNNPKATEEMIDADGFLHTGDVGYYNDNGQLFYVDRIKELIKVKGFQVPPIELESIIKSHTGVLDVGVIGVPDRKCGEKPVAFVVPVNSSDIHELDVKRFVAGKVAPYKQLANVIFVDSIPRNPSGKILKRILREKYESSI